MNPTDKPRKPTKLHKHRWSRKYEGIFNGPVRLCLNGECGAMKYASGKITIIHDGRKRP